MKPSEAFRSTCAGKHRRGSTYDLRVKSSELRNLGHAGSFPRTGVKPAHGQLPASKGLHASDREVLAAVVEGARSREVADGTVFGGSALAGGLALHLSQDAYSVASDAGRLQRGPPKVFRAVNILARNREGKPGKEGELGEVGFQTYFWPNHLLRGL